MNARLPKGSRITGEGRNELSTSLVARYTRGESIRSMAEDIGRSYGFVHGVLVEAGVTMRSRGGATRGAAAEARRAQAKQVTS